jgi:hypothetical protein
MNREETAKLLTTIATHYWQTANMAGRNVDLMIETWAMTLSDIPLTPYIENALEWWFKHEEWPPQASQLRERAQMQIKRERDERKNAETLALYSGPRTYDTSLPGLVSEWNRRRKEGVAEEAS